MNSYPFRCVCRARVTARVGVGCRCVASLYRAATHNRGRSMTVITLSVHWKSIGPLCCRWCISRFTRICYVMLCYVSLHAMQTILMFTRSFPPHLTHSLYSLPQAKPSPHHSHSIRENLRSAAPMMLPLARKWCLHSPSPSTRPWTTASAPSSSIREGRTKSSGTSVRIHECMSVCVCK